MSDHDYDDDDDDKIVTANPKAPKFYLGNQMLKNAGVPIEWTPAKLKEYAKCAEDPIYFFEHYIKIIHVDHGLIKFKPREYQKEMIKLVFDNRFTIVKWPRQHGKTTTVAAMLLWYALFKKKFNIALLAHKQDQAIEIMERIQLAFENLPDWLQQGIVTWNKKKIKFENGSRISAWATSAGGVRGQTYNIVYLDEFAFVAPNEQETFYTATYPVITSGKNTKIVMTSTPNGMDLFYKFWNESELGRNSYVRHASYWWDIAGRDEAWKQEQIMNTSERQFSQEFETEFLGSTFTLISGEILRTLTYAEPLGEMMDITIFETPQQKHHYVCCVDSSEGLGQDYHAFSIIDVTSVPYKVCAVYHNNKLHHMLLPNVIYTACNYYNEAMCLVESMSTGQQVAAILLHDLEYENVVMTTLKGASGQRIGGGFGGQTRLGVMMNKQVKSIGCTNLKALIEQKKLIFNDERILKEFFSFTADKLSYKAEEGKNDDLVMTLVLFGWMVAQHYFRDSTDTDVRSNMVEENIEAIEQDLTGFGVIDNHQGYDEDMPTNF